MHGLCSIISRSRGVLVNLNSIRSLSLSSSRLADVDIEVLPNGVRTFTLNRPKKKNALTTQMDEAMVQSLYESNDDPKTKIVVVQGTGGFFTAGIDIMSLVEEYQNGVKVMDMGFAKLIRALIDSRKPIIALVNGPAVGIGATMLTLCETVYASDKATFNMPFINLGIPPECASSYMLPKIMGHAKAGEMLNTAVTISAEEAYTSNLITRVYPQADFEKKTWEIINKMAEHPLQSLVHSKALLRDREREILHQAHRDEFANVDFDLVAKQVMKYLSGRNK